MVEHPPHECTMSFCLADATAVLQRTPIVVRALLAGLSDQWVHNNYGPQTWSPFDVIGHLIHAERTNWIPRAQRILDSGPSRPFEPFDRFAQYDASRGKSIDKLLDEFDALRQENIGRLRAMQLDEAHLDRNGTHPELGPVTLRQLLATWVVHDLNHIHQIAKAMAFQYRDEIGPWRQYLSILPKHESP